jgi:hypothetical protein
MTKDIISTINKVTLDNSGLTIYKEGCRWLEVLTFCTLYDMYAVRNNFALDDLKKLCYTLKIDSSIANKWNTYISKKDYNKLILFFKIEGKLQEINEGE